MLRIAAVLTLAGLCVAGPAKIKKVTRDAWEKTVAEIRNREGFTIDKINLLHAAASGVRIVDTARILDIVPYTDSNIENGIEIVLVALRGAQSVPGFAVKASTWRAHQEALKPEERWKKWDRITWLSTVQFDRDGRAHECRIFDKGLASLTRTKNPGITPRDFDFEKTTFEKWRKRLNRLGRRDIRGAYYLANESKAFAVDAVIKWLDVGSVKIYVPVINKTHFLADPELDDPQLREVLKNGLAVVVAMWVRPDRELKHWRGGRVYRFAFWRLEPPGKGDK